MKKEKGKKRMKTSNSHLASSPSSPFPPARARFERSHRFHRWRGAAWTSSRRSAEQKMGRAEAIARSSEQVESEEDEEEKRKKKLFIFSKHHKSSRASLPIALSALRALVLSLFRPDAASRLRLGHGHAARRNRRRARRQRKQARGFDANDVGVVDRPSPIKAGFLCA